MSKGVEDKHQKSKNYLNDIHYTTRWIGEITPKETVQNKGFNSWKWNPDFIRKIGSCYPLTKLKRIWHKVVPKYIIGDTIVSKHIIGVLYSLILVARRYGASLVSSLWRIDY